MREFMEPARARVAEELFHFIQRDPGDRPFVENQPERAGRHRTALPGGSASSSAGVYDDRYFQNLQRIGATHVRIGLSGHFVNAGMNLLRTLGHGLIRAHVPDRAEAEACAAAYDRIVDMNLDVITGSYREAELRKVLLSARPRREAAAARRALLPGLKFVLVLALMGISLGVVALFVRDAVNLVVHRDVHGVLTALGSLLVIWVMVELMENEIRQLRGGRFKITIFLGVALVAFIREMLISSLQHGNKPEVG